MNKAGLHIKSTCDTFLNRILYLLKQKTKTKRQIISNWQNGWKSEDTNKLAQVFKYLETNVAVWFCFFGGCFLHHDNANFVFVTNFLYFDIYPFGPLIWICLEDDNGVATDVVVVLDVLVNILFATKNNSPPAVFVLK